MSEKLLHLNSIYEAALANTPDFVYVIGIDHRFIYANKSLLDMWGRSAENTVGRSFRELDYEPWHADMHDREIDAVISTRKPLRSEIPFTGTQGRRIYDYIFSPILGEDGSVIAIAGTTRDITERKQTEDRLRKSEERAKLALEASEFIGTWNWDLKTGLVVADQRFAELYSVDPAWAAVGAPVEEYIRTFHPDDAARLKPKMQEVAEKGGEFLEEYRLIRPDGSVRWVIARGRAHLDEAGNPLRFAGAVVDITDRKLAENKSEQQRRIYETALDNTADFNYIFDLNGRFTYCNKSLLDLLQKPYDDIIGKDFFQLGYPPELAERLQREIQHVICARETVKNESQMTHANGARSYEYIFQPVLSENGTVEAVAGSTRDITDYKEADYRKDEFLAMLSHELRNPLAPISNAIGILKNEAIDKKIREQAAALVDRQLAQITNLLNDLLDVSRLTLGRIELRRDAVALSKLVEMAVESVQPLMAAKSQRLDVRLPEEAVLLHADPTRLSQVFTNLLNNAAKYTQEGGAIVVAAVVEGSDILIQVRDNGIGLPKEMQPRIFELFAQVDSSMERSYGGLGIGLTLVKNLVEMHDGTVKVESEGKGRGSVFSVRLPILSTDAKAAGDPSPASAAGPLPARSYRILVVDDNEASAKTLGWTLELLGHDIRLAHDGASALTLAKSYLPHVVLLDIGLPHMNGYEVCRELRLVPALREATIIAQTGWGQKEHLQRSKEAGFDHHLVKPISLETLKTLLENMPPPAAEERSAT